MPWKQAFIPIDASYDRIRTGVEILLAAKHDPCVVALFTRTSADRIHRVLLLSPAAVELVGAVLSRIWSCFDAPQLFEWDLVVGSSESYARLGLSPPKFGINAPKSPIALIGRDPLDDPSSQGR